MKVVYIQQRGNEEPWYSDFAAALDGQFEHVVLDHDAPYPPQLAGARVVVDQGGHATRPMIDAGADAGVELWQCVTTGLDHTEVGYMLSKGIRVSNTPGQFSAIALAEHVLLLMLCFAKHLREGGELLRRGILYHPLNHELAGTTLGLVGLGASGRELARRAVALDMRVVALDAVTPAADELAALGVEWLGGPEALDRLLRESDYVSLHVPLTAETRNLIGREQLALLKPTAVLVNVARGGIVDEAALAEALAAGRLRGAGVDVYSTEPPPPDDPLLNLPNVVATPHTAGTTYGTSRRRAQAAVENCRRVADGLPPLHEVVSAAV
jgi:phosphoglycerate dehydrogenase-like enzyme